MGYNHKNTTKRVSRHVTLWGPCNPTERRLKALKKLPFESTFSAEQNLFFGNLLSEIEVLPISNLVQYMSFEELYFGTEKIITWLFKTELWAP